MPIGSRPRLLALTAALALGLTACGGAGDDAATTAEDIASQASAAADPSAPISREDLEENASEMAEDFSDMADNLEGQQTGGSASLTVGDETWDFDGVLCAFGPDEIGQEGAEFVLSAIADGVQFYLSIDEFGHSASIHDVQNFEDPTVSWDSDMSADGFITVSGKEASGEVGFVDYESDLMESVPGSFEATCP
ncbi:MAG TPA: hypothetical protein VLQ67_09060 [Arachnia sp.]|nr:hypothetical protein [Arachnia sp.]